MNKNRRPIIIKLGPWLPWVVISLIALIFASEGAQLALSDAINEVKAHRNLGLNEQTSDNEQTENSITNVPTRGNIKIRMFSDAKDHLKTIYRKHQVTFYCACKYKNMRQIDFKSCDFESQSTDFERTNRIEWEHLVPAYELGHHLPEWKTGSPRCVSKKGKRFRGRKCAERASETFQLIEADMHNLVPTIGEINALRSNLPMNEIPTAKTTFGSCQTKINQQFIEPRNEDKGFAARAHLYINQTYPNIHLLNKESEAMFKRWDKKYPPDDFEKWRNKQIKMIQGNSNPFIDAYETKYDKKEVP